MTAVSGDIVGPHIGHTSGHSVGIRQGFTVLKEDTGQLRLFVHIRRHDRGAAGDGVEWVEWGEQRGKKRRRLKVWLRVCVCVCVCVCDV